MKARIAAGMLVLLAWAGCDFPSKGEPRVPSLIGEWDYRFNLNYAPLDDSRYRLHLKEFLSEHGIESERMSADSAYQQEKVTEFNRLVEEFPSVCLAQEPCRRIHKANTLQGPSWNDTLIRAK